MLSVLVVEVEMIFQNAVMLGISARIAPEGSTIDLADIRPWTVNIMLLRERFTGIDRLTCTDSPTCTRLERMPQASARTLLDR